MKAYKVKAVYQFAGIVTAESEDKAIQEFWDSIADYYEECQSERVSFVAICSECDGVVNSDQTKTNELECECE